VAQPLIPIIPSFLCAFASLPALPALLTLIYLLVNRGETFVAVACPIYPACPVGASHRTGVKPSLPLFNWDETILASVSSGFHWAREQE